MTKGKFITLEGGDGAGKSTQTKRLVEFLRSKGIEVVQTREIGGAPGSELIRDLWLKQPDGYWDYMTELLLVMAARREHIIKTIRPALDRSAWVVSDRFVDSTRVYQGMIQQLGLEMVDDFYKKIAGDLEPDLTLILDLPVDIWVERMNGRKGYMDDRYQQQDLGVHHQTRAGFLSFLKIFPHRTKLIDASVEIDYVTASITSAVIDWFKLA